MKTFAAVSAAMLMLAGAPYAYAELSCPADTPAAAIDQLPEKCRAEMDTWAMQQPDSSVEFSGEILVGAVLPETVTFVEVPAYTRYGYVVVNKRRLLVDRDTRMVVRIYP